LSHRIQMMCLAHPGGKLRGVLAAIGENDELAVFVLPNWCNFAKKGIGKHLSDFLKARALAADR